MAASNQTDIQSIRISADDFKNRLEAGEPITVLDARAQKAWDSSKVKVAGAIRVKPDQFQIDPSWPKDRLTVVY